MSQFSVEQCKLPYRWYYPHKVPPISLSFGTSFSERISSGGAKRMVYLPSGIRSLYIYTITPRKCNASRFSLLGGAFLPVFLEFLAPLHEITVFLRFLFVYHQLAFNLLVVE